MVGSVAVNPSFLLSPINSSGTFGQESLFSLWPGNQRDPWPDRHSTADQTGWVPLEWHLEPLQGMRAPTDLQSSRQNLSGLKEREEKEVLQTQMVWKRLNQVRPQCCGELTPEQLEVLLLSGLTLLTDWKQVILSKHFFSRHSEMFLLKYWYGFKGRSKHDFTCFYFQKWKGLYYFTKMFDYYLNSKKLAKKQTFILATWQKEGQILREKRGILAVSWASQSSTDKWIPYIKQHILLLSTTGNSTAQAWVFVCIFPFLKNIPSALSNREGGEKEKKW